MEAFPITTDIDRRKESMVSINYGFQVPAIIRVVKNWPIIGAKSDHKGFGMGAPLETVPLSCRVFD